MKFTVYNEQQEVPIAETLWRRAFHYAAGELQIEHHHAHVACFFLPAAAERKMKFKHAFTAGASGLAKDGAVFFVIASKDLEGGRMIKTFFHELTHVKQLLMSELIAKRTARSIEWKGEKWDKQEYAFAPWEIEANAWSAKFYESFLRQEVSRIMKDANNHAYHVRSALRLVFPDDDLFRLTQELHREREAIKQGGKLCEA